MHTDCKHCYDESKLDEEWTRGGEYAEDQICPWPGGKRRRRRYLHLTEERAEVLASGS